MSIPAATTYISRHETFISQQQLNATQESKRLNINIMATDTDSHASSGSQYLQDVLGDVLADALSKVARERPTDPIQYVADYLHNLKPDEDEETLHYEETEEQQNEDANFRKSRNPSPIKDPADDLEPDDDNTEAKKTNEDGPNDEKRDVEKNGEVQSKETSPNLSAERQRTANSDPISSLASTSISQPASSTEYIADESSTKSLDRKSFKKKRKSTTFSKNLPAVAMSGEEYKIRRGILPPMRESPKSSPDGEPRIDQKPKNGVKAKPRQLEPIESFDEQKHQKRNRKLTEQSNRGNSIYKQ